MDSRKKWKKTVDSDNEGPLFPEGWARKAKRIDSDESVTMRCDYFPRAGRRRKNAFLTTTFHYFPRAVRGRQSDRDARRDARRASRAGEAAPSRSKYICGCYAAGCDCDCDCCDPHRG